MANKLFGLDIAKLVSTNMPGMHAGTLNSIVPGARTGGNPGGGNNPTSTPYSFKGFASTYKKHAQSLVLEATHSILMLAGTMTVPAAFTPKPGDTIVMGAGDPELSGKTLVIVDDGVTRDPASATWTCLVKEI